MPQGLRDDEMGQRILRIGLQQALADLQRQTRITPLQGRRGHAAGLAKAQGDFGARGLRGLAGLGQCGCCQQQRQDQRGGAVAASWFS